jgi:hypothetical protein
MRQDPINNIVDNLELEGSMWEGVPRRIPRFAFSSLDSPQRYAAWRTEIGGALALEFDWRGYDSNPSDLDPERRKADLWPMGYPAFSGGVNNVAPIVYWTRAQAEPRAMTGAGNPVLPLDPLSPRHREQRSSDHYTSMVRTLREQAPVACRFNSSMNEWWSIPGQGADFAPRFLHPSVDTNHVTPQDRLVDREMVAVIPIAASAQGLSEFMWSNASTSSPVRGVAIGQLNVRNALWTIVADSQGTAANLPTRSRAAYAQSRPDEWGWPVVYAFGGVDQNSKLSNAFYRGTPVQQADLNVTYEWQRITGSNAPVARVEHSLVVGGSGRYVYVAGGRDADGKLLGDVHRFDSETNVWTLVTNTLTPRAQMGVAAADDLLYLGGGVEASGYESGLIVRINGLSGVVSHSVNALPTGAWPDLSVSPHTDGLIYAGGRVGSTWYRDIWRVDFNDTTATASFLHDFGSDGLVASEHYAVQGDLLHGFFWGVPGRTNGANALGTWFVDGNSQGQVTQPGSGGVGLLRVAGPTSPARQRGSRLVTRRIGPTRPGSTTAGVR